MTRDVADILLLSLGDITIRVLALTIVAACAARVLKRASASVRRVLWMGFFAATLLITIIGVGVAGLRIAAPSQLAEVETPVFRIVVRDAAPAKAASWQIALLIVFGAGSLISIVRGGIATAAARRWRRDSTPADADLQNVADDVTLLMRLHTVPLVRETASIRTAGVVGVWRPRIIVSSSHPTWTRAARRHVIAHELAHIAAGDHRASAAARAIAAIHWWNPCVRVALNALLAEQELAADARVVASGSAPVPYAETLLNLAAPAALPGRWIVAASGAPIARRIEVLLAPTPPHFRHGRSALALAFTALIAVIVVPPRPQALRRPEPMVIDAASSQPGGTRHLRIGRLPDGTIDVAPLSPTAPHPR